MDEPSMQSFLRTVTGRPIRLVVTENRSLMLSFKTRPDGDLVVRAHRMFLEAPPNVHRALGDWILRRRNARRVIRRFIDSHRSVTQAELPLFGPAPGRPPRRDPRLRPRGSVHDLGEMRDALNRDHFDGKLTCAITWGRRIRSRARRHFTFGTYSHAHNLVRVHPRLDSADVPRFFVEFIVYHEMLHAARGQEGERNGRRIIHSRQFRADERKFARYREAIDWEKRNLHRFLAGHTG